MTETIPIYKRWRKDVEQWQQQGEVLEAIAARHPDIPFVVEPISHTAVCYIRDHLCSL